MNISYTKQGVPNLMLKDKEQYNIGKYGLLRLQYIKKEKLGLYFDLLVNDTLNEYLHNIDTIVMENVENLIKELAEKENGICSNCKNHFNIEEMEADHITPWNDGGKTNSQNCQMLCRECNRRKSGL